MLHPVYFSFPRAFWKLSEPPTQTNFFFPCYPFLLKPFRQLDQFYPIHPIREWPRRPDRIHEEWGNFVLAMAHSRLFCTVKCSVVSWVKGLVFLNCRQDIEQQLGSLILATDINRQNEFLIRLKSHLDNQDLRLEDAQDRHFMLQVTFKIIFFHYCFLTHFTSHAISLYTLE